MGSFIHLKYSAASVGGCAGLLENSSRNGQALCPESGRLCSEQRPEGPQGHRDTLKPLSGTLPFPEFCVLGLVRQAGHWKPGLLQPAVGELRFPAGFPPCGLPGRLAVSKPSWIGTRKLTRADGRFWKGGAGGSTPMIAALPVPGKSVLLLGSRRLWMPVLLKEMGWSLDAGITEYRGTDAV